MLIASNFLLWIAVTLLAVAVLAQARHIAALRDAAASARPTARSNDPPVVAGAVERSQLLLFVAAHGDGSSRIVSIARSVAAREAIALRVLAEDGDEAASIRPGPSPYGVLRRPDGVVAARGPAGDREQIESLVIAAERAPAIRAA